MGALLIDEVFLFVISELAKFAIGLRHTLAGQVLSLVMAIGYYAALNGSEMGQTFGKRALTSRSATRPPAGHRRPAGRPPLRRDGVVPIVPFFIFFTLFDGLWALWDRDRQALHDKIAGTAVVRVTPS